MSTHLHDDSSSAQSPAPQALASTEGEAIDRRSFLRRSAVSAGAGLTLLGTERKSHAGFHSGDLFPGDAAILRLLEAAEIIESDLWQQYNELAGIPDNQVPGGTGNPAFTDAVSALD